MQGGGMALGPGHGGTALALVLALAGVAVIAPTAPGGPGPPSPTVLAAVASEGLTAGADRAALIHWGADLLGPAPSSMQVQAQVFLQTPDPAGLRAYATAVSSPGTLLYHHYLTVPQFASRFGAAPNRVRALDAYFRAYGLKTGALAANGLAQTVQGPAGGFSGALHVPLGLVRVPGNQLVAGILGAPRLPESLAPSIALVEGLAPWAHLVDDLAWAPGAGGQASSPGAGGQASYPGAGRQASSPAQ